MTKISPLLLITLSASTCGATHSARAQETPLFQPNLAQRLQDDRAQHTHRADIWAWQMRQKPASQRRVMLGNTLQLKVESAKPDSFFPSAWQWSSDRERAVDWEVPGTQRVAQNWNLGVGVPVEHPWGVARISANYRESGGGVATDADTATAADSRGESVAVQQDLKLGALSGSAKWTLSQNAARAFDAPAKAPDNSGIASEGEARLRLQVQPNIALTTSLQSRLQRDSDVSVSEQDNAVSVAEQLSRRQNHEVGLEWKWSKSLSLNASAGQTRFDQIAVREDGEVPLALRDENRAALSLQHRTKSGALGMKLSRQWAQDEVKDQDKRADVLSLNSERNLTDWLSVRGSWRLSGDNNYTSSTFSDNAQREAEARINSPLGRFALRYSDGSNRSLSGENASTSGSSEYGIRYNAGRSTGLGLAVEYSVRDQNAAQNTSQWRLGVTYK